MNSQGEKYSAARSRQRLAQAAAPVRARLTRAGVISIVSSLLWIGQAAAVAWLFSALLAGKTAGAENLIAVAMFVAIGIVRAGLDAWSDRVVTLAADQVIAQERHRLLAGEVRRSPVDSARPASAALAALAAEKLDNLRPYLARYQPAYLRAAVVPLVLVAVSATQSWVAALVLLFAGPLIPVFMALVGIAAQTASERQMDEISGLNALLMERLMALVDIRLLDATDRMLDQFRERAEGLRASTMAVLRIAFLSSTVLELFAALGVAMVAIYVGFSLLGDLNFGAYSMPLTAGQGVFLLMLAPAFFQPLRDVAAAWHDKAAAGAVARDLLEMESTLETKYLGEGKATAPLTGKADISVRGLCLRMGNSQKLCYPDFDIKAGQTVAITGPSGAGKSALIAALAGLLRPSGGCISVAGEELTEALADRWRARLAWVPQRPHFFARSLRWNLTMGAENITEKQIEAALSLVAADGIIARLSNGLQTRLGEIGSGVSGGEARRLIVARAALSGRDVILADEPTADLDAQTAAAVTRGLMTLAAKGTTLIVATHDQELSARMDRRIELAGDQK